MSSSSGSLTVGVFGGSFNPPHVSHVLACLFALSTSPIDRILVIPSYVHPLDKALLSFDHRLTMTRLAFRHLEPWVQVSTIEEELGGVSFTIETLSRLKSLAPQHQFRLIVGSDILDEVQRWRRFDEIVKLAPLLVVPRIMSKTGQPGAGRPENHLVLPAVSSSEIREVLLRGDDPGERVPLAVRTYIREHGLYRLEPGGRIGSIEIE